MHLAMSLSSPRQGLNKEEEGEENKEDDVKDGDEDRWMGVKMKKKKREKYMTRNRT